MTHPVSDRPILFSAPMIRALLDGRKTQTRRILKVLNSLMLAAAELDGGKCLLELARFKKGDRLYVRESFMYVGGGDPGLLLYRATWRQDAKAHGCDNIPAEEPKGWKPGIHLPRKLSRLTLAVTDVRVQRLREISEADAKAEGIKRESVECADGVTRALWLGVPHCGVEDPVAAYSHLWESINNPRGLCAEDAPKGWAANPWIVAVTFRPELRNIDQEPT